MTEDKTMLDDFRRYGMMIHDGFGNRIDPSKVFIEPELTESQKEKWVKILMDKSYD